MSENAPKAPQHEQKNTDTYGTAEEREKNLAKAAEQHSKTPAEQAKKNLEQLHHKAEHQASKAEELLQKMDADNDHAHAPHHYKAPSISQTLAQARRHLKPSERALSKIVHNPKVEVISDAAGATIARPSGLLYGALFSFIGSLGYLIIAKRYGYEYNAFVAILTFGGGFVFGLFVEAISRLLSLGRKTS